jgi:phosphoenolpyruvate carboxykinase (GTP)
MKHPPKIFHVNWFRQNASGKFVWPGFGENLRVLRWVIDRCNGGGAATESAIGHLPAAGAVDMSGLDLDDATRTDLFNVDAGEWKAEAANVAEFFAKFGDRLPAEMERQRLDLLARLG